MKQIATALVKAQTAFAPALKTSSNPHFKSRYADLAACVEAVVDALNSNGIALLQKTHPDDKGVTVETVLVHESGEMLSGGCLHVPAAKHDPQGYGSALTYARRYSLMAACGIAPEDDDGNAASKTPRAKGTIKPTDGAAARVAVDAARELESLAVDVIEAAEAGEHEHAAALCSDVTDPDEKVYLWSKLPSHVRTAIKKVSQPSKEA